MRSGSSAAGRGGATRVHGRRRPGRARLLLLLAVVVLVPAIVAGLLWFAPFLRLSEVQYHTAPERMAALKQAAPVAKGQPLVEVDTDAVREQVLHDPLFAAASVTRSWPSSLVVEATPRTPVVAVEGTDGSGTYVVSADAVAYEKVPSAPDGVLTARADAPQDPTALRGLVAFVTGLDADLLSQARDLRVDARGRITATVSGVEVVWGTAEDSALKAAVVRNLVGRAGVARIDVSVPMEPVTAPRTTDPSTPSSSGSTGGADGPSSSGSGSPSGESTGTGGGVRTPPSSGETPSATSGRP